jgi:hypothetical protein
MTTLQDFQFFRDNAGYIVGERALGALRLAQAEQYAQVNGWEFEWTNDFDGCIGCDCNSESCPCSTGEFHEVYVAVLRDEDGHVLASLGGICQPESDPAYRRVVNAELALEALSAMGLVS